MSDFSKFKIGSTSYDVKDANAGRTLSISGNDLSLKNAAGTAISTVTLPGGGSGYLCDAIKLTGSTVPASFNNTSLTISDYYRYDGTTANFTDIVNDYINDAADVTIEYSVGSSENVAGKLSIYVDASSNVYGISTIYLASGDLVVIKLSGTLFSQTWTGDKISLGGGGGGSTNIYTISTSFPNLSRSTMQSITLDATLTAAQLRTNMDAGVVRIKDSQGSEVTLLGYNTNGLFFGTGIDSSGSTIRFKMQSNWGTNWEGQVTSL